MVDEQNLRFRSIDFEGFEIAKIPEITKIQEIVKIPEGAKIPEIVALAWKALK